MSRDNAAAAAEGVQCWLAHLSAPSAAEGPGSGAQDPRTPPRPLASERSLSVRAQPGSSSETQSAGPARTNALFAERPRGAEDQPSPVASKHETLFKSLNQHSVQFQV